MFVLASRERVVTPRERGLCVVLCRFRLDLLQRQRALRALEFRGSEVIWGGEEIHEGDQG